MKEPNERGLFVYLSPFRYDFWLSFALSVALTSFIISCVYYVETIILGGVYPRRLSAIFADTLWFTFGSVFQQGMPPPCKSKYFLSNVSIVVWCFFNWTVRKSSFVLENVCVQTQQHPRWLAGHTGREGNEEGAERRGWVTTPPTMTTTTTMTTTSPQFIVSAKSIIM